MYFRDPWSVPLKNISMRHRLIAICGFFLSVFLLVSLYILFHTSQIVESLDNIGGIQLPALRKITLVDMQHEELEAMVYKALYAVGSGAVDLNKEIAHDYFDAATKMRTMLNEVDSLQLNPETKTAIKEARPAIEGYINSANEIIVLSGKGQKDEAILKLKDFNVSFHNMETKLDSLGDLIEKEAMNGQVEGRKIAHRGKNLGIALTIFSLIFGIICSWFIVNSLMKSIADTTEDLSVCIHDIQNSSQKMSLVGRRLASTVEKQVSSITTGVSAMDIISTMIKKNDQSASHASQLSTLTKSSARSGKNTVDKMMEEMKDISMNYDEIQASINQNSEDIKKIIVVISQIAQKTEVVNDIVFQSKLLSFNASIEAARAGESGKGFSVVAQEVGNLAQMSGKVASDITKMLKESQEQVNVIAEMTTRNIIKIVDRGRSKVQEGNIVAAECLHELDRIISCVNDLDNSIQEISVAIKEQSIEVDKVKDALKHIDDATHESNDMSGRSKDASEKLRFQSHELRNSIQGLRKILGAKKSYDVAPLDQ